MCNGHSLHTLFVCELKRFAQDIGRHIRLVHLQLSSAIIYRLYQLLRQLDAHLSSLQGCQHWQHCQHWQRHFDGKSSKGNGLSYQMGYCTGTQCTRSNTNLSLILLALAFHCIQCMYMHVHCIQWKPKRECKRKTEVR